MFLSRLLISSSRICRKDNNSLSLSWFRRLKSTKKQKASGKNDINIDVLEEDAKQHDLLLQQYRLSVMGLQQVLVVQPYFEPGHPDYRRNTNEDLMMEETLGLVSTLEWKVVDAHTVCRTTSSSKTFFSSKQLNDLRNIIVEAESRGSRRSSGKPTFVSGVFVSAHRLTTYQRLDLEENLEKPVIDRYNVILQIFQKHAMTREAQLQVKLAEIPYLKSRLLSDFDYEKENKHSKQRLGDAFFDKQRMRLQRREKQIKAAIAKIKDQRVVLRQNRLRARTPSVAVVGYTNSGKTSLIKAITGTDKLQPRNQLFATLDVTGHVTVLPSQLETVLLDTVGFISDIPIDLIASFNATLEDAALADLIIHVRDVSNPDHEAQDENVQRTLRRLKMPKGLIENMITVGNKIDLIESSDWEGVESDGMIPVSTKEGTNMERLLKIIDESLIRVTDRKFVTLTVPTGGEKYDYLMQNVTINNVTTHPEDPNAVQINAIVQDVDLRKYEKFCESLSV